jgi:hypothetical protein
VAIITVSTGFGVSGKEQLIEAQAPKYGIEVGLRKSSGKKTPT